MQRVLCAFILTSMIAALAGCGGGSSEAPTATGERAFLSLGTAPPGGAFFVVGGALAEVLNGQPEENWSVTAEATSGSQENIRRLATGELDFALSNAAITYFAMRGTEGWDRAYPVRTVMTLAPNIALFLTRADSDVQTISDLRGKRVTIGPAGAGFEFFVDPLLSAHGVSYDDFNVLNVTQTAAVDMLADGSAEAVFIGGAIPTASITQATASMEIRFLPFDDQAARELAAEYVFFAPAVIPADTYKGQTADFPTLDVGSMHLITAADQTADLVYRVTKALYENQAQVVQRHAAGNAINPINVVRDTGTEFHPGAIRYYQEIGIWPN